MSKPKRIDITDSLGISGISVEYIRSKQVLNISGWYDSFVGIEGARMPLKEFFERLGIKYSDVVKALFSE